MAVSKRLRFEILRRDNHTCRYCGANAPDTPLRVDHVVPVALGGTDHPSNLVTSCEPCNNGKSSTILGTVAPVSAETVPPSPDVLADEVLDLWLDAFGSIYGTTEVTFSDIEEVRLGTLEMYRMGASADSLRRSATICGLKGDTFIGLSETSDAGWLLLTAEAFRIWRSLWHETTKRTRWPDMNLVVEFEDSVTSAINAGADRFSILRAAAAAGHACQSSIDSFLKNKVTKGGGA